MLLNAALGPSTMCIMQFSSRLKKLVSFALLSLASLPKKALYFIAWAWNNTTGRSWYLDLRLDKYVFCSFTWIVWEGFMRRFGLSGLSALVDKVDELSLALLLKALSLLTALQNMFFSPRHNQYGLSDEISWSLSPSKFSWKGNPAADLDLSVSTDCEDLAAFSNDVLEFIEQDRSLLLDSLTDLGASAVFTLGALKGARVLSSRIFKRKR